MNTTLDPTRDTTVDSNATRQFAWPLAGTQVANAHLTWTEYVAWQAAMYLTNCSRQMETPRPLHALPQQLPMVVVDPSHDSAARWVWPLPATQLPHAHLTWPEWLEAQAGGVRVQAPERAALRRAS